MAKTKRDGILANPNRLVLFLLLAALLIVFLFYRYNQTISLCANNNTASSQTQITNLVSFVDQAVELVASKGEEAFTEFRVKDSKWWKGNSYIFVYDLDGNTLVLPPQQDQEGVNRFYIKDSNGTYYVKDMIELLNNHDSGWVQYSYPKPDDTVASPKLAYVKKVNLGNKIILVGSGVYFK